MNVRVVSKIVRIVNREIKGSERIDNAFVRRVVEGGEFTPSHPVHQRIMALYEQETAK